MTFIDWSDPEEMLGLLTEYVADAWNDSRSDPGRSAALGALLEELTRLIGPSDEVPLDEVIDRLQRIKGRHSDDLGDDPVFRHVEDCIGELVRIREESGI
jgi:hypothetical protein